MIAIGLINSFLQVKLDRRMSANKALDHEWFSKVNSNLMIFYFYLI